MIGVIVFFALVAAMLPDDFVYEVAVAALRERGGVIFKAGSFKRNILSDITAENVEISLYPSAPVVLGGRIKGQILKLDRLEVSPGLFRTMTGSPQADFSARIGQGTVSGKIISGNKITEVGLTLDNIVMSSVPVLASLGIKGNGALSGRIELAQSSAAGGNCPAGTVALKAEGVEASAFGALPVSLLFKEPFAMDAEFGMEGCKARLKQLGAEGADFKVLVNGDVMMDPANFAASKLNLTVNITQKKSDIAGFNPMTMLGQYKKSENFYSFNVKGSVERPEMSK